ncbi:hypothetical protein J5226_11855 [Lysobacter sp. K5869]|uniref:hypothetical protein n=1 Tax=Lysobacter sp. K5869 TaxID=2820808 RepID=UPI001C060803|nr:hypothetical protein [Lysobacter sp. K5869]QWP79030.1 hypothetical protein J5226_11855 [Lysobacter sp. K5869]
MNAEDRDSYNQWPPLRRLRLRWHFAALLALALAVFWPSFPRTLSGDEFARVLKETDGNSYGYWYLYRSDAQWHCVGTPYYPYFPDRHSCVSTREVEILPDRNGEGVPRYLGAYDVVLKAGRYPGAKREALYPPPVADRD